MLMTSTLRSRGTPVEAAGPAAVAPLPLAEGATGGAPLCAGASAAGAERASPAGCETPPSFVQLGVVATAKASAGAKRRVGEAARVGVMIERTPFFYSSFAAERTCQVPVACFR